MIALMVGWWWLWENNTNIFTLLVSWSAHAYFAKCIFDMKFKVRIARPVNVRLKAKIYGVLYNPVSSIDF